MQADNNSLYPLKEASGENWGSYDQSIIPIEEKNRSLIPKSDRTIKIGQTEEVSFGTLKCQMKRLENGKDVVSVGLYKDEKIVGLELLYEPTADEIKNGIPEWKFDAQQISTFATAWDFSSTDLWFWTIRGLREKGTLELSKHIND